VKKTYSKNNGLRLNTARDRRVSKSGATLLNKAAFRIAFPKLCSKQPECSKSMKNQLKIESEGPVHV